ncbi:MAG: CoA pyrophosphatase [Acidipropionibacterium sp.]|nr:CoA pyrophosphatase [Acidipropionibacterium sp.]
MLALISDTDSPDIVLTRRNAHLRHHAGQVSLPGGRAEPQDADIVATALREAHEEVGLPPAVVRVIGTLPATLVAVSSSSVTTVVASWDGVTPLGVVDPGEVAGVRRVAMSDLADPANRAQARHPSGFRGPAFLLEDLFVWGFTAQLLSEILDRGGWSQPWDRRRVVEIPTDYLGRTLTS